MNQQIIDNLRCQFLVAIINEDAPTILDILEKVYDANRMDIYSAWREEVAPFLKEAKRTYGELQETELRPI